MNENDVIITDDDDADSDEDDYETFGFSESLLPENILSPRGDLHATLSPSGDLQFIMRP